MPIFIPVVLGMVAVVAGGAAGNEPLQREWAKWWKKDHKELTGPGPDVATAPLRTATGRDRPLWMAEDAPDAEVDPRLADVLVFNPALDGTERKATHWTLNDKDSIGEGRGDGGA